MKSEKPYYGSTIVCLAFLAAVVYLATHGFPEILAGAAVLGLLVIALFLI